MNNLTLLSKHWCDITSIMSNAYAFGYETPRNQRDHGEPG